jgi:hypothetical protein
MYMALESVPVPPPWVAAIPAYTALAVAARELANKTASVM